MAELGLARTLHELEMAIREQRAGKNDRRIVKDLERAKKRLDTRLKVLLAEEKKDNTLTFEELGVDRLFIDEAHSSQGGRTSAALSMALSRDGAEEDDETLERVAAFWT